MSSICWQMRWLVQVTAKAASLARASIPQVRPGFRQPAFPGEKRCAAQAEYGRLAAQA